MSDKKRCVDCKHFAYSAANEPQCLHPENEDLVDGRPLADPMILRHHSISCGMNGLWWEPKEPA